MCDQIEELLAIISQKDIIIIIWNVILCGCESCNLRTKEKIILNVLKCEVGGG